MKFSRVERKLLLALITVAVMPMLGALFLGRAALREAYQVGINSRVKEQLETGLALYRTHFSLLRDHAQLVVSSLADDHRLHQELKQLQSESLSDTELQAQLDLFMDRYPQLSRLSLQDDTGHMLAESSRMRGASGESPRRLSLSQSIMEAGRAYELQAELLAPDAPFRQYQAAGELVSVYAQLERNRQLVSNYYLLVYMCLLLVVIVVAVSVGIGLSRRVTRRLALLADATARVGAGDLTVQVPASHHDEISELTAAFNAMVNDIRESRDRIEYLQRLGAWQEFARRLAHEIKNPLTPIQLAVQEIHRSYAGNDERYRHRLDEVATIVEEEVATLRRLVGEFSDFARLPRAILTSSDLGQFLSDASASICALGEQVSLSDGSPAGDVRCLVAVESLPVNIDSMMLKRCVENLVRNALQSLRDSGRSGHVEVGVARRGNEATLFVRDDGPGVADADRERIFDPYVTTKGDGTGLGLAIVKKVVFEHGGEIRCEPRKPSGVVFEVLLPIAK